MNPTTHTIKDLAGLMTLIASLDDAGRGRLWRDLAHLADQKLTRRPWRLDTVRWTDDGEVKATPRYLWFWKGRSR